jgi:hypothetical protein
MELHYTLGKGKNARPFLAEINPRDTGLGGAVLCQWLALLLADS